MTGPDTSVCDKLIINKLYYMHCNVSVKIQNMKIPSEPRKKPMSFNTVFIYNWGNLSETETALAFFFCSVFFLTGRLRALDEGQPKQNSVEHM